MTGLKSRKVSLALLASSALVMPSIAQAQIYQPQKYRAVDANGVDVTWGDFLMNFVEGSIGSGEARIDLVREAPYRPGAYDNNSNNLSWDRVWFSHSSTSNIVNIGSRLEKFTPSGTLPSGSTLSGSGSSYTYTTADGTVLEFGDPTGSYGSTSQYCNATGQSQCTLLPTSITSPDGKTVTIAWEVNQYFVNCNYLDCDKDGDGFPDDSYDTRITEVSNSFGYHVGFTYTSDVTGSPSAENWHKRTRADLFNDVVSTTTPQSSVSYAYPSAGVTQVTDIGGRVWRFTGTGDRVTGIRRPGAASDTTSVSYNGTTGLVSSVTREGVTTTYSRSVVGSMATMTVTDPASHTKVITSDLSAGRPTSIVDELSRTTSFQYDTNGRLTRTTLPEGNYTSYTYDGRGNVTQVAQVPKAGSGLSNIVASASYDTTCINPVTCNEPNSTTDAKGNQTDYTYDSTHGGVLTVTRPAATGGATRPQTRYSFTSLNGEYRLTGVSACQTGSSCTGTSDEVKSSLAYDSNGNVTSTSSGNGSGTLTATSTMTYDAIGNLLTVDGPLSGNADTTRYRYDAARELIGVTSPDPDGAGALKMRAIRNTYTNALLTRREMGTVNSQSDADWALFSTAQQVDVTYDANARVAQQKLSSGGTNYALTQMSYDSLGRLDCSALRMSPAAYGSLPSSACTLGTAGSFGSDRISQTVYDYASEPTQLKVAVGTSDAATERTLTYSNNGLVQTLTDGENNKTTYFYDGFDRLSQTQFPNTAKGSGTSNASDYEQLSYDANSNVTSFRNRAGSSITFGYDNLDRVTQKTLPSPEAAVTYSYDLLGRLTSASQTGNSLSFTYDALSRKLTEVGPQSTATSAYDLAGRRTQFTYPGSGLYVNTDYLVTGEPSAIRENGATSGVGVLATYAYDNLGNRTAVTYGNGAAQVYSYDAVSRLSSLTNDLSGTANDLSVTFSYNPANQIVSTVRTGDAYAWTGHGNGSTSFTQNGLNQQITIGGSSTTWDSKGNLTSEPQSGRTYGYSSENLLTSASGSVTLGYDPAKRLYQVAGAATTRFAYDGAQAIADYDGSNTLQHRYVFAPGIDQPIVQYDGTGTGARKFLSSDERGSIISQTDSGGTLIGINTYDEYGKPGASNIGRFQYTGQVSLPEINAYYYKARVYLPHLGIFAQTDPIGPVDSPNLYPYVLDDPGNLTDPLGLCNVLPCSGSIDVIGTRPALSGGGNGEPRAQRLQVDIPIEPGGGGESNGQSQPSFQKPTAKQCILSALGKNAFSLGLDALAIAADVALGPELGAIAALGLGAAAIGNSIAHDDLLGVGIAYGGRQAGVGAGLLGGRAASIAHGIARGAIGLSILNDSAQVAADYQKCTSGNGR